MPAANTQHLMLEERVIDAVKRGAFQIYAISTIDEALTLLMGLPAGELDDKDEYPTDSVNGKVMAKIEAWIQVARKFSVDHTQGDDSAS
jgi:predicted ATP-dependent protease